MNRRNFIQTVGATMSASLLPVSAANLRVLKPKQPNVPLEIYRSLHPGAILRRIVDLAPQHPSAWLSAHSYHPVGTDTQKWKSEVANMIAERRRNPDAIQALPFPVSIQASTIAYQVNGGCSTGAMLRDVETNAMDIARIVGIPEELLGPDASLVTEDVQLHHITRGQNVHSHFEPGSDRVYWTAGTPYAVLYYVLPDKTRFIFQVGGRDDDQPKMPEPDGHPAGDVDWAAAHIVQLRGTLAEMALASPVA